MTAMFAGTVGEPEEKCAFVIDRYLQMLALITRVGALNTVWK